MLKYLVFIIVLLATAVWITRPGVKLPWERQQDALLQNSPEPTQTSAIFDWLNPAPSPTPTPLPPPPSQHILQGGTHTFQTFNNCGPAALSMALSHYGIQETQSALGQALRPYQVPGGDNDDKSVTLEELAEKAKDYNLTPYHRPNGTIEEVQQFVAAGMPVIMRTWLKVDDDIGHYRVVKGYNADTRQILQDDSLQGKDLWYSEDEFNALWEKYNYEFLVLVPADKTTLAEQILGEDANWEVAWTRAAQNAQNQLDEDPSNIYARFNLVVALHNSGDPRRAIDEFEKIEGQLPFRTLWYQIEPIQAYVATGNTARVFAITDRILNNQNRAFSELYLIRGNIYKEQGKLELAREEFRKAVQYNTGNPQFQLALDSVSE